MTSTLDPIKAFFAQPTEEDEGPDLATDTGDPLGSIATSLSRLVDIVEKHDTEEKVSDRFREELDDLEAKYDVVHALVLEIEAIVKPSTSKLANSVRDAIARWSNPDVSETAEPAEPTEETAEPAGQVEPVTQPAHDADVAEWREYACSRGLDCQGLEQMNRSQIRTALGIPQVPVPA